jgi:hypothetical protein
MPVFVTQIDADTIMLMEAETSGAFAKSESEIRANPMGAFDTSMGAIGRIGRLMTERLRGELAGTAVESVECTFGVKVDGAGAVMIAQENDRAQFTVKLQFRTG